MHFCVSQTAVRQLAAEGITRAVHWVGDVMLDASLQNRPIARQKSDVLTRLALQPKQYALVTVHRAANTDDPTRLQKIVESLNRADETIVFPAHPRTRKVLMNLGAQFAPHVKLTEPMGYFDMMVLEENARLIATDSGGVQREAYFMRVPCVTLRDETEWTETVTAGWNKLAGVEPECVLEAWRNFKPPDTQPPIFGDGTAGQRIAQILEQAPIEFGKMRLANRSNFFQHKATKISQGHKVFVSKSSSEDCETLAPLC
jgi:UDP-N-acetylglucosamine 2-epimerase